MSPDTSDQILVIGTGSMASLFAARLAESGVSVTMLGSWTNGLEALRKYGVRCLDATGQANSYPVRVIHDPLDCPHTRYALVLVKSWGTQRAASHLARCLAPDGLAITLQNGLGNQEILAAELGEIRVVVGVTTYGANLVEPGLVRPAGEGQITIVNKPGSRVIASMLQKAGFQVNLTVDARSLIWGKLLINAAINPLTALLEVPNGKLLEVEHARTLMKAIIDETMQVAQANGTQLPYPDPHTMVEDVARRTSQNRSSMLQDILRGTPTEIDSINGAIVNKGQEYQVLAPVNFTLWQLVKAKEVIQT